MRLAPERSGNFQHINSKAAPPSRFIAVTVELAMMTTAQRNGELVAHFAGERAALCEPKVVGIGRKPTAHKARLACHQPDVIAIAYPPGLW
jgi:hypothetical protein